MVSVPLYSKRRTDRLANELDAEYKGMNESSQGWL